MTRTPRRHPRALPLLAAAGLLPAACSAPPRHGRDRPRRRGPRSGDRSRLARSTDGGRTFLAVSSAPDLVALEGHLLGGGKATVLTAVTAQRLPTAEPEHP